MSGIGPDHIVLERYKILRRLGGGAMGEVWLVVDANGEHHALKTLGGLSNDHEAQRRFRREAETMASLKHPHIVGLHDVGVLASGEPVIVMQFVDGYPYDARIREATRVPWREALTVLRDVLHALHAAHALGIVHRDVKPANVLLERRGDGSQHAYLADFGIVRLVDGGASRLTATGMVTGTVDYIAPEQLQDLPLTGSADLYAAGLMTWEAISGGLPFPGMQPVQRALRRCTEEIPHLSDVPLMVANTITGLIRVAPQHRLSAQEAIANIQRVLADPAAAALPASQHTSVLGSAPQGLPPGAATVTATAVTPASSPSVHTAGALLVAQLPASRLALSTERRWLADLIFPRRGMSMGPYWFAVVPPDAVQTYVDALGSRYGGTIRTLSTPVDADFAITAAAAAGVGALPKPLAEAIERLASQAPRRA